MHTKKISLFTLTTNTKQTSYSIMAPAVSGLASSIRSATESETFDLAGQNPSTIISTMRDGFGEPFDHLGAGKMIRITFITGAGKLARQKYDDGAAKAVTSTLRDLGFEEDRAASAVVECAGTFKSQHDTGKNLKTVVVFPKVKQGGAGADGDDAQDNDNTTGDGDDDSLYPKSSPEHMIAFSSVQVFGRMVTSKCPSWSQKKACVAAIASIKERLEGLDSKLMSGTPLTDKEQTFYDTVSVNTLDEKQAFVREKMQKHVEDGKITFHEKQTLLRQVNERIGTISEEITTATKSKKPKRVENLKSALEKAQQRKAKIDDIASQSSYHPLKHEAEINKLRKELQPLLKLEEGAKGRLLSIKETQEIGRKDEILEHIEQLEQSSRGWFEEDDVFESRIKSSRSIWESNNKSAAKKKGSSANKGFTTVNNSNQRLLAAATKKSNPWGTKSSTNKKKPSSGTRGGGVFAAMMMDSDSE